MRKLLVAALTIVVGLALAAPAAAANVFTFPIDRTVPASGCIEEDLHVIGTERMIINTTFPQSGDRFTLTVHFVLNAEAVGVTSGATYHIVGTLGQAYMEYPAGDLLHTFTIVSSSKTISGVQKYSVHSILHLTFGADGEPIVIVDDFVATCT